MEYKLVGRSSGHCRRHGRWHYDVSTHPSLPATCQIPLWQAPPTGHDSLCVFVCMCVGGVKLTWRSSKSSFAHLQPKHREVREQCECFIPGCMRVSEAGCPGVLCRRPVWNFARCSGKREGRRVSRLAPNIAHHSPFPVSSTC